MFRLVVSAFNAAAVMLLVLSPVAAQSDQSPEESQPPEGEIVVRGDPPLAPEDIRKGLSDLTRRLSLREVLPRYFRPLCPEVLGLTAEQNRKIAERIRTNAIRFGLEIADAGCQPNAVVIVTDQPKAMFDGIRRTRPGLFGPPQNLPGPVTREFAMADLTAKLDRREPAITWSIREFVPVDGVLESDPSGILINRVWTVQRSRASYAFGRTLAVVLFDWTQLDGVSLNQLADYATLQMLGSPRKAFDPATLDVPTILTLFHNKPSLASPELTRFDRAYLCGLYQLPKTFFAYRLAGMVIDSEDSDCVTGTSAPPDE